MRAVAFRRRKRQRDVDAERISEDKGKRKTRRAGSGVCAPGFSMCSARALASPRGAGEDVCTATMRGGR